MQAAGRVPSRATLWGGACALVLVVGVWQLRAFTPDDAFITFSYAQRHAAGDGWVASAGTPPAEGFSTPLWAGLLDLAARLGLPLPPTAKWLAVLAAAAMVVATAHLAHAARGAGGRWASAGPALLATWTPLALWTASGMENALYGFILVMGTLGLVRELWGDRRGMRSAFWWALAVWTRPEAFGLAAVAAAWRLPLWRTRRRETAAWLVVVGGAFAALLAWRYATFGDWLPNTYYAKQNNLLLGRGWGYLGRGAWQAGFGIVAALSLVPGVARFLRPARLWHPLTLLTTLVLAQGAFVLRVGGDWMHQFRFLTPLAPFAFVLAGDGAATMAALVRARRPRLALAIPLVVVLAWAASWPRARHDVIANRSVDIMSDYWRPYRENLHALAAVLEPGAGLVIPELGYPSFATDLRVLDPLGLASPHVAHLRYERVDRLLRDVWRPEAIKPHSLVRQALRLDDDRWFRDGYLLLWGPADWQTRPAAIDGWYVRRDLVEGAPDGLPPARFTVGGALELRDVRVEPPAVRPGERVRLHLAWVVSAPAGDWRYGITVHTPEGRVGLRETRQPLHGWRRTQDWPTGRAVYDWLDFTTPTDTAPGQYRVGLTVHAAGTHEPIAIRAADRPAGAAQPAPLGAFEVVTALPVARIDALLADATRLEEAGDPAGAWRLLAPLRATTQRSAATQARVDALANQLARAALNEARTTALAGDGATPWLDARTAVNRARAYDAPAWPALRAAFVERLLEEARRPIADNPGPYPAWRNVRLAGLALQADPASRAAEQLHRALWAQRVEREREARAPAWKLAPVVEFDAAAERTVRLVPAPPLDRLRRLQCTFVRDPASVAWNVDRLLLQVLTFGTAGYRVDTLPLPGPAADGGALRVQLTRRDDDPPGVLAAQLNGRRPLRFEIASVEPNPWGSPHYPPQAPVLVGIALLPDYGPRVGAPLAGRDGRVDVWNPPGAAEPDANYLLPPAWTVDWEPERAPDLARVRPYELRTPLAD